MAVFSEKQNGYKVGVVLFCIGVVAFIVGFASPYWTTASSSPWHAHKGLWRSCRQVDEGGSFCVSITAYSTAKTEPWYKLVQALQCLALIGFLLAGCHGVYINWCTKLRIVPGYPGVIMFSAMVGFAGAFIFAVEEVKNKKIIVDHKERHYELVKEHLSIEFEPFAWSFFLDIIGCILTFVAATLIAVFNKPLPADTPSTTMPSDIPDAPGPTHTSANRAATPDAISYAASPCTRGQPVAVDNAMNPPSYEQGMNSLGPVAAASSSSQLETGGR